MQDNTNHPLSDFDDSDSDKTYVPSLDENKHLRTPQNPQINTRGNKYDDQSQTLPENETQPEGTSAQGPEDSPLLERSQRAQKRGAARDERATAYKREKTLLDNQALGGNRPKPNVPKTEESTKTPKHSSFIWKYIQQVSVTDPKSGKSVTKNQCNFCKELLACEGSSTSGTKRHLVNIHFAMLDKKDLGVESSSSQQEQEHDGRGRKSKLVQRSLTRCWRNQTLSEYPRAHPVAKEGDRRLALLIVKDLRPLYDCNSPALANFIHNFDPKYHMPRPDTLRSNVLVPMLGQALVSTLLSQ